MGESSVHLFVGHVAPLWYYHYLIRVDEIFLIGSLLHCLQAPLANEEDETCRTFVLHEEDHTLGNALRYIINKK